jgi:hypothetical protein
MTQVDGPQYKLLLKKDKAHDMDINSVQWSPGVRFSDTTLVKSHVWQSECLSLHNQVGGMVDFTTTIIIR